MSPWAVKRLKEFDGDISQFRVVRLNPSVLRQVAIAKTEPGDENNQDISSLVGKVDIRKLDRHSQDDPDAYSYSGCLLYTSSASPRIPPCRRPWSGSACPRARRSPRPCGPSRSCGSDACACRTSS